VNVGYGMRKGNYECLRGSWWEIEVETVGVGSVFV